MALSPLGVRIMEQVIRDFAVCSVDIGSVSQRRPHNAAAASVAWRGVPNGFTNNHMKV